MEISSSLLKYKLHILISLALSLVVVTLVYISPKLIDILAFFWPLLLSTALFLVAIVLFGKASPLATESQGEKTAEGLLDFVAGLPEELVGAGGSTTNYM